MEFLSDKRVWLGALVAIAAVVAIGGVVQSRQSALADEASLKAQQAAMGDRRPGGPGGPTGPGGPGQGLMAMADDLNLTPAQRQQLEALQSEMRPPTGGQMPSPEEMRTRMESFRTKLDAILTPEQRAKAQANMPAGGGMPPMAGMPPMPPGGGAL
jgi:Spy/CpxP family protein refolding chaperone